MARALAIFRLLCGFGLAAVALAGATAGAQVMVGPLDERIDPWPHVRVLEDPARTLTLEQAIEARGRFEAPRRAHSTLGMDKAAAWVHVPLAVAPGAEGTWIFGIDYALLVRVDVYLLRDGRVVRHVVLGNGEPFATRPLRSRSFATPLELAAGAQEILLRVDTRGAKVLPLSLERPAAFHARAVWEQLVQGALVGLGVILLLYSLAQWGALRRMLYAHYALLVACSTLFSLQFFGVGEMYLWTDNAWIEAHMAGMSALLATTATSLFVVEVLGEDLSARLRTALRVVAAVHLAATIAHGLDLIDAQGVAVFMATTGLTPGILGLPGAIAQARRGERAGAWFIFSWLPFFVSCAVMVGVLTGLVGANPWTLHSFQLGSTFDMLIFLRIALLRTASREGLLAEKERLLERVERERSATADALEVAREAMRARALFLAAASHDLRQPLYALSLLSDTLASEPLTQQAAGLVDRQRQAIGAMRTLFDNLLDLSRFDAGEIRPTLRALRLRDVLAPLCVQYETECRAKGLRWVADLPDATVRTDGGLLQRLVGNLLSNAVRYTSAGEVRLTARVEGERVSLSIADTGRGIPHDETERVFQEFVQLGNVQRDPDHGVGLGLSIVRRISNLLDAGVVLDSAVGRGTTVRFGLPVASREEVAAPSDKRVIEPDFAGLRAWLLEDTPMVRAALVTQLASWGIRCEAGSSRADLLAFREASGEWPDVVILDDMLGPGESGLEIARWLTAFVPASRILLQTGNADPRRSAELEESGFVMMLKPLSSQDLAEWLHDATRQDLAFRAAGR